MKCCEFFRSHFLCSHQFTKNILKKKVNPSSDLFHIGDCQFCSLRGCGGSNIGNKVSYREIGLVADS